MLGETDWVRFPEHRVLGLLRLFGLVSATDTRDAFLERLWILEASIHEALIVQFVSHDQIHALFVRLVLDSLQENAILLLAFLLLLLQKLLHGGSLTLRRGKLLLRPVELVAVLVTEVLQLIHRIVSLGFLLCKSNNFALG